MFKKLNAVIAVFGAACLLLSGCGTKDADSVNNGIMSDENVTAPGELPIVKEKEKLTIGIQSTSKVENYQTNAFTKFLEEKTNIDLDFYEFPSSGGMDKLNVMLASGTELPDVISSFNISKNTFLQYAEEGVFLDLTDYIDKYGYWMKEVYETTRVENFDSYLKTSDGKRYFIPAVIEQQGNLYGGKAFINKTWLDQLGLSMPETIDEFKEVMIAFTTQDPNGNGKNDEIGFTGSKSGWNEKPVNFLMNSFIYDDYSDGFVANADKKLSLNYTTEKYKQGLEYIADMVKIKALDIQCYTQDSSILRTICSQEDVVVGAFASGSPDSLFPAGSERLNDYVALPPLKGPDGVGYTLKTEYTPQCSGVITKYCKNPVTAYRLLDFMMSEEASLFARYGVEGTDWKEVDESTPALFESLGCKARILQILPYGAIQNSHWNQLNPSFRSAAISDTGAWDGNELDGEYFKAKALSAYVGREPEAIFSKNKMTLTLDDMTEFNGLHTDISNYVTENVSLFLSGEKNFDSDWNGFQKSLENLNIKRYLELAQKGFDAFNSASE